ncbi:MAG: peptide chain release factor N(5)-glutamine methyltransferase [Planctomycetota bacterium]|jgi:release factor glutamine methyltransferase
MDTWSSETKQSQTNPNKAKLKKAKMNVSSYITVGYENKSPIWAPKKQTQTSKRQKPMQTSLIKRIMKKTAFSGSDKTNPNEPKQTQFQARFTFCEFFFFLTFLCPGYNLPMQTWTIQKLLNWMTEYYTEKGIDAPRLNAELLLSHVLKMERIELYTQFDKTVTKEQLDILHDLVKRAGRHEPICYLTGKTEFYSLQLQVSPDCMIPRPETELLVERAIEFLRSRPVGNSAMRDMTRKQDASNGARNGPQFVCDLCTGCGCIAVAIAKNFQEATIIATDICGDALNIAAKTIETHDLKDRITLLHGDLFEPIVPQLDVEKFDLIVSNPPYVSASEFEKLDKCVKEYEPRLALFAGIDGLDVYRRIIDKADRFLRPDGALILEIGYAQGPAIKELLEQTGAFAEIKIEKDFHDNDRIVSALRTSS